MAAADFVAPAGVVSVASGARSPTAFGLVRSAESGAACVWVIEVSLVELPDEQPAMNTATARAARLEIERIMR